MHCTLQTSKAYFLELLHIRYSSPLFRLQQAAHIKQQVRFHNTGPSQVSVDLLHDSAEAREGIARDLLYRNKLCIEAV